MTSEQFIEIRESLVRIETKIAVLPDHEHRIRRVEKKQTWLSGAAAAAGAIVGFIFHKV